MAVRDIIGEATEYDKKLKLEEKKPKSWLIKKEQNLEKENKR